VKLVSAAAARTPVGTYRALRRLLREEDAWVLRQLGSRRPALWLRPQPLGAAGGHGIMALRVGADGLFRGALKAAAGAWPWADDSVPAIVLQHVSEGAPCSVELLTEAARVLEPEGMLYLLRFNRFSPWYWRYGRWVVGRSGGSLLALPLDLAPTRPHGLVLEYGHALGARGLRAAGELLPKRQRAADRRPFGTALRAARVWVLRKRRQRLVMTGVGAGARTAKPAYDLALVRRERNGATG
jgi:SAM-dependent methyltransferase